MDLPGEKDEAEGRAEDRAEAGDGTKPRPPHKSNRVGYVLPLLLSLVVHALTLMVVYSMIEVTDPKSKVFEPAAIQARLISVGEEPSIPKTGTKPEPTPLTGFDNEPISLPPLSEFETPKAPPPPLPREERKPNPELERLAREEEERRRRLEELASVSELSQLDQTLRDFEQARTEEIISLYATKIYSAVVSKWSRPPSARNHMKARFMVELIPSGELLTVTLLEGSGNEAFDRSAEVAVRRVGRFDVPNDRKLFEDNFRRFTLLFSPKDLLR